ncbi:MAG: ATP-binding protein [Saprospiraceae bacterium]
MKSSPTSVSSVESLIKVAYRFSLILVLFLFAVAPSFAADPYAPDTSEVRLVKTLNSRIKEMPTLTEKLNAYLTIIDTYSTEADFPVYCELLDSAHDVARFHKTTVNPLDSFNDFTESLKLDALSTRQKTHIKFMIAKFRAFDGSINDGEKGLLEILNLPAEKVHPFTLTSAHYMAAYCSYYTNQLERSAYHARKSAEGFFAMGDQRRALEGYDGTSTTFFKLGKIDSALHYARKGLSLTTNVKERYVTNLYLNYAEALMGNNQPDSAFYYALTANDIISRTGRAGAIARAQMCLANITSLSGKKSQSIPHYQKAIKYFKKAKEDYHRVDALDSLAKIHGALGQYRAAYDISKVGFQTRDSLREDRLQKDADKIVVEFQRDAFKKELAASEGDRALAQAVLKRRQSERVSMFGVVFSLLLLISFIYYRAVTRKRLTRDLQAQVAERTAVLRENSERLEVQAQRLTESNAELERFAYIASHDLKTPLRNVTSFLGLIQRRLPVESRALVQEYLDIALANARQMHDLVTDVLEFSRLNADVEDISEDVKVSDTIDAIRDTMLGELEERNATITMQGDAGLVLPKGALEQILANLIGNGLKYNEAAAPLVEVFVTEMDERVRLTVKDNGIGIAPEYHERIFEVFRRLHTTDKYSGTGVGLAACRKVVLRLGGTVSLESQIGEGATFHVDIPRDVRTVSASRRSLTASASL